MVHNVGAAQVYGHQQEVHMRLLTIKHSTKSRTSGLLPANDKTSQKSTRKQKWRKGDIFSHCPLKEYKHSHSTVIPPNKFYLFRSVNPKNLLHQLNQPSSL